MPYPNEHACRLRDPGDFTRFISQQRTATGPGEAKGKKYRAIIGVLRDTGDFADQAYRYRRTSWTEGVARSHCKAHNGKTFEAATGGKGLDNVVPMTDGTVLPIEEATPEDISAMAEQEKRLGEQQKQAERETVDLISPRNPYGTNSSYEFKGGRGAYRRAWRTFFSRVAGGAIDAESMAPIRGTIRRMAIMAARTRPVCPVRAAESIKSRNGISGPLDGEITNTAKHYSLETWKSPASADDPVRAECMDCEDINDVKRAAVAEMKRRIDDRKRRGQGNETTEELELYMFLREAEAITGAKPTAFTKKVEETKDSGEDIRERRTFSIVKVKPKQRKVMGIVYAPLQPDSDGDYMEAAEIEKASDFFMQNHQRVDEMHDFVHGVASITQNFIARAGDPDFPEGAWVVEVKIHSDEVWKKVLKGEYKAFSFAGTARRGKTRELDSRWIDDEGNFVNPYEEEAA